MKEFEFNKVEATKESIAYYLTSIMYTENLSKQFDDNSIYFLVNIERNKAVSVEVVVSYTSPVAGCDVNSSETRTLNGFFKANNGYDFEGISYGFITTLDNIKKEYQSINN